MKIRVRDGKSYKWGIGDYVNLEFGNDTNTIYRKTFHANLARGETPRENAHRWANANADILTALICEFDVYGTLCPETASQRFAKHLRRICQESGNDQDIQVARDVVGKLCGPTVWWEGGPQGWATKLCLIARRPVRSHFRLKSALGFDLCFMSAHVSKQS
jgi:hypothetical protein